MLSPTPGNPAEIPFAVLIVFASTKLLREIFERLKQPGIAGEILAGLLVGPYVLNWIRPNDVLSALAELGVMFLLFRIGLEVKPSDLLKVGASAVAVAVSGVTVSFLLVGGIALWWLGDPKQALFISAAMVSTSVVITAEVLSSLNLISARASKVILAAAVVDDVLGLIVLALVSSYVQGHANWPELILTAVLAIAFTGFMAFWGHRAVKQIVPEMRSRIQLVEAEFTVSMALLFSLALVAVYAGVAAIIGAFFAGMALSETVEERVHTMTGGVAELLVPFFLAGIGMRLDPAVFADRRMLTLALILLIAAIAAKLLGCGVAALGLGRTDAFRVGAGMAPRGEVGMVVAQLGRKMGVMPGNIFAMIIFLSLATTLAAPPLIRVAFRKVREPLQRSQ
jgi:Kef-type K+ transport system membrane component KefB